MKRCYVVSGMVQGVGFRYTVLKFTKRNYPEIKGYVKNLPDGTVEICVEGEEDLIKKYIHDIGNIEFYGYIKEIKESNRFISGHYNEFMIEY